MKKILTISSILLAFILTSCVATMTPRVTYTKRPAYVYYDNAYGTYVYLPYKIKNTSPRYVYRKHIKNYRGHYKTYTRDIRFYKPRKKVIIKNKNKKKRKRKKGCCPH
jgi:hypothetical protein